MDKFSDATLSKLGKPQPYRGCIARFPRAILALSQLSVFGTNKHEVPLDDVSFTEAPDANAMYIEAECRHLLAEAIDGPIDHDFGLLHKVHKAWCAMADLEVAYKHMPKEMSAAIAAYVKEKMDAQ